MGMADSVQPAATGMSAALRALVGATRLRKVLVLDVNRKYGPWLVKPERLYQAMNTLDHGAEKKRGLLSIE
jgi:hypothetical protein